MAGRWPEPLSLYPSNWLNESRRARFESARARSGFGTRAGAAGLVQYSARRAYRGRGRRPRRRTRSAVHLPSRFRSTFQPCEEPEACQ